MPYYSESILHELNHRGRPRLITVLGELLGARHHGFDGDGTPKGAISRIWEFSENLTDPLPAGVVLLTEDEFNEAISTRERNKPVQPLPVDPDPEEAPFTPAERKALRALLR